MKTDETMMNIQKLPFAAASLHMILHAADFRHRTARAVFWTALFSAALLSVLLFFLLGLLGTAGRILTLLWCAALCLPFSAMGVRRLHDTGKCGWWMLIGLTVAGLAVLTVFWAKAGDPGCNLYGENPAAPDVRR